MGNLIKPYRMAKNENLACSVEGCTEPRRRYGGHCKHHSDVNQQWGDPHGRALPQRDYQQYREWMSKLIKKHGRTHPGLLYAREWLVDFVQRIAEDPENELHPVIIRLVHSRVTPEYTLAHVGGVWLYDNLANRKPYTSLQLNIQLGYALNRSASLYAFARNTGPLAKTPVSGRKYRLIGETLRNNLSLLFANFVAAWKAELAAEERHKRDLLTPFET